MDELDKKLLEQIADLHGIPEGSFNIRKNGESMARNSTSDIEIVPKTDKSGIDIIVHENVKNKSVHIPVLITVGDFKDVVYNDFYVGKNADVTIVAGCGIHNGGACDSVHDGIHTFHLEEGARVRYIERHVGTGDGAGGKVFNPITKVFLKRDAQLVMETTQLGGVTDTVRKTYASVGQGAKFLVKEKLLTDQSERAISEFRVKLLGCDSHTDLVSRSVARGGSFQRFKSLLIGKNRCFGHVECDGILTDNARIVSTPAIDAAHNEASLVHEAAIGKIAGEQLLKLMTLGLSEKEAEDTIIEGFLG
ncbi:MAG: SufD family Fe-S cluster assembly protein [Clostridiales bacterium]|nr:SufD family Fe-S cluster assembly protein [Clostridiales bacterium]